jgi:hypothetical protein
MGEVAWVRLERRRRRRGCVVVVVDEDDAAAIAAGGAVPCVMGCGDCCIGVVWPSPDCGMGVTLLVWRLRITAAMNSPISTSIMYSSASGIGEEGEGGLNESASESHGSERSELVVSGLGRRGLCGARRPEEKKEE